MSAILDITSRPLRRTSLNARPRVTPVTGCLVQWKTNTATWNLGPSQQDVLGTWCVRNIGTYWDAWGKEGQDFLFVERAAAVQFTMRWRGATGDDLLSEARDRPAGSLW